MADMTDPDTLDMTTGKFAGSQAPHGHIPSPDEVVAALFGDKTYGRRRVIKPHGTPKPKSFKPKSRPRRGWQPNSRLG